MRAIEPTWTETSCSITCPYCKEEFEVSTGSYEWFMLRRRYRLEALDQKAVEGNVGAIRLASEMDGSYTPKQVRMNVNTQIPARATREVDLAKVYAVRVMAFDLDMDGKEFDRITHQLRQETAQLRRKPGSGLKVIEPADDETTEEIPDRG